MSDTQVDFPPEETPSADEMSKRIAGARQIFLWRNFGTIGYDAYMDWVKNGSRTNAEEESLG